MSHYQHQPEDAAPARRDRRRPPGPPEPGRTRGLARRDRGHRPHPHLPPPETRPDPAGGPHRAHRPRHARRALRKVTRNYPAISGLLRQPVPQARLDKVQRNFELRKVALGTCGRDYGTEVAAIETTMAAKQKLEAMRNLTAGGAVSLASLKSAVQLGHLTSRRSHAE